MGPGLHRCSSETYDESINNIKVKIFNPFNGQCSESFRFFSESEISFFHNDWRKSEFFPPKKINFLGVNCNIPKNPHYFLSINYSPNYMSEIVSPSVNHKSEEILKND